MNKRIFCNVLLLLCMFIATKGNESCAKFGPTYIRWGRTDCRKGAELVYDGYAAGKKHSSQGSGSNYLCLTKSPEWGDQKTHTAHWGKITGVEMDVINFTPSIFQADAPCAVCQLSLQTSVLMIPGKKSCPVGWTEEFWGYLMSELDREGRTSSEYVCVDNQPHGVPGGEANNNDAIWYMVRGFCGSLKCPPYINFKELTCVVCSR